MGSPTQSLASAVDGMLAQTVAGALGPTPAPKRKQPELEAAGQAPDEASATAEAAAEVRAPGGRRRRRLSGGNGARGPSQPLCPLCTFPAL